LIEYAIFVHGLKGHYRNEIWHKGSLGDKDDARMSNTRIVQRKCTILHSMMKARRNIMYVLVTVVCNQPVRYRDGAL